MLYFAYGSNMCTARLAQRIVPERVLGVATLADHRMQVDLIGGDGSAKCNIAAEAGSGDCTHGVLFELDDWRLAALHEAEGPAYEFIWRDVQSNAQTYRAAVYRGLASFRDATRRPFDWYMRYVCAGARAHGLPPRVLERLAAVPTQSDPDMDRAAANRLAALGD